MEELANKTCIPCKGGVPPLPVEERKNLLEKLAIGWELTHDNNHLFKSFKFNEFKTPMKYSVEIGRLAEEQGHHPDMTVGWGHLEVEIWTHKIGSLVESDFILAAKIDRLMQKKGESKLQKITPCLWFDNQAEMAVEFYTSIFKNSKVTGLTRYGEAGAEASGRPKGSVMTVTFQLEGQDFMALNGGPVFTFSPAISLMVNCQTQQEIDILWKRLSEGGQVEQCGWLKDKYGVSWQLVPTIMDELFQTEDYQKSERVMKAMLKMDKIDLAALKRASLD
ncbi:MAG: VOC family protein [Bdellovibrio sp.]|nr:VOC family protein [Bdellovibrio sp.]